MLEIHGKVAEINIGNLDARGNTLITIHAEGENYTHAFYLDPKKMADVVFKLTTRTAHAVVPTKIDKFWTKVG